MIFFWREIKDKEPETHTHTSSFSVSHPLNVSPLVRLEEGSEQLPVTQLNRASSTQPHIHMHTNRCTFHYCRMSYLRGKKTNQKKKTLYTLRAAHFLSGTIFKKQKKDVQKHVDELQNNHRWAQFGHLKAFKLRLFHIQGHIAASLLW